MNPWKRYTCTAEHYKIYQIPHGYSTGVYNKAEAKVKFEKVDLSDLNKLRDNIKNIIKDITKEDKKMVNVDTNIDNVAKKKTSEKAEVVSDEKATKPIVLENESSENIEMPTEPIVFDKKKYSK